MKKITSQKLYKRLTKYSALSVAISGVAVANGQIEYYDVNPDEGGINTFSLIDFDQNGEPEFIITQYSTWGTLNDKNAIRMFPVQAYVSGNAVIASTSGPFIYPLALDSSALISNANAYWNSNYSYMDLAYGNCYLNSNWCSPGVMDKYLGLRFKIGSSIYYGWARLDITNSSTWTLKDYAYNSTPDASILAGQGGPLGIDDNDLSKIKIVALHKSIGLYNLQEVTNYRLYNMTGQEVLKGTTDNRDYVIEAPTLASGIYIVELGDTTSSAVFRKKVVLQ